MAERTVAGWVRDLASEDPAIRRRAEDRLASAVGESEAPPCAACAARGKELLEWDNSPESILETHRALMRAGFFDEVTGYHAEVDAVARGRVATGEYDDVVVERFAALGFEERQEHGGGLAVVPEEPPEPDPPKRNGKGQRVVIPGTTRRFIPGFDDSGDW